MIKKNNNNNNNNHKSKSSICLANKVAATIAIINVDEGENHEGLLQPISNPSISSKVNSINNIHNNNKDGGVIPPQHLHPINNPCQD